MRRVLSILLVIIIMVVAWAYLFTGTPPWGPTFTPKNTNVASIELSWIGKTRTIQDSNQCAEVLRSMSKARQFPVATTPAFGHLIFHYMDGTTNQFFLSPAGRFSALEIANKEEGYAISMDEMLRTFHKVGLLGEEAN
jgi:hypothetical protein